MDVSKILKLIKQIELPNNERFWIVGYDEKYLYIREHYDQMTVKDLKIDFNGNVIDEYLYDNEKGGGYVLLEEDVESFTKEFLMKNKELQKHKESVKIQDVPFFAKYSFTRINPEIRQEESVDLTEVLYPNKSVFEEGTSYEKGKTFYYPTGDEKKRLLDHFKIHNPGWLNPEVFIGIFSDKLISKIQLQGSLFLSCRLMHCVVQKIDKYIKPGDKVYPYCWLNFLEIGMLTLNPLKYEIINRFPRGIGEKEFNAPDKIIPINDKILIKDNGQYTARDRIHIFELQK